MSFILLPGCLLIVSCQNSSPFFIQQFKKLHQCSLVSLSCSNSGLCVYVNTAVRLAKLVQCLPIQSGMSVSLGQSETTMLIGCMQMRSVAVATEGQTFKYEDHKVFGAIFKTS